MESPTFAAGWYPDPTHRFEFRYYNGERWTADVSQQSHRYIDPIGTTPPTFSPPSPSRSMAITALVFSLCAVVIAWMPFLFVLGAAGAVVATILGIIVLRRAARSRNDGNPMAIGQGMAISAMCASVAALALCFVGFQLTRVVLREVDELINPGPYEVAVECDQDGGYVIAEGSIINLDTKTHDYTIAVEIAVGGDRWETVSETVVDVAPGERAPFTTSSDSVTFTSQPITCEVDKVYGPTPFSD